MRFVNRIYGTFCIMGQQVIVCGELKSLIDVGVAKASFNRAYSQI